MTGAGGRRRAWRWAAGVWAALAVTGGGLTLWLQDANEPPPPAQWQEAPTPQQTADPACPVPVHATRPTPVFCG
ncbi:hypothetical protein ABZ845_06085 [Streptomyces sp. NPDC047022]|uniref:hypothetical protein n=1 Tax=Streptomyces sp. NPDC047022 TaxID=3155737 RepID=UPI0033ED8126